jgi:hypothetical protein
MSPGPWEPFPERLVSERLAAFANANAAVVAMVRPPIPMIGKVAPKFGYRQRALGIDDVVRVNEVFGPNSDPSTQRPGYSGTSLPGWSNG